MSEIAKFEAERNLFKGKYRALLKLVSKTRDRLVHITDHIEDEGDRQYFGSTNDADALRDLYDEMMSWVWDAVDETNRMKSDPYADIREQRALAERAVADLEATKAEIAERDAALAPFARMAEAYKGEEADVPVIAVLYLGQRINVTVGDLRDARAALNASEREA